MTGAVLLLQVATVLPMLEVACTHCERRGRLSTARLLTQHLDAGFAHRVASVTLPGLLGRRTLSKRLAGIL